MISVALETSTRMASVALGGGDVVRSAALSGERAHASDLLPVLERLRSEVEAGPRDIELVVVGTGPGSYTGLRVGVATAIGLVRGTGARLVAIPSTECLAFGELAPGDEAAVLLNARSEQLYLAHYRRTPEDVEVLRAPCVTDAAGLSELLPAGTRILGDPTVARAAGLSPEQQERLSTTATPHASHLLALGRLRLECGEVTDVTRVAPLYLRPFAAKERRR